MRWVVPWAWVGRITVATALVGCAARDSTPPESLRDAGGRSVSAGRQPIAGGFGPRGSALPDLLFACVGDTRPAIENDTAHYPVDVIQRIFQDIESLRPRPPFVISTGDYVFASGRNGADATAQFDLYLRARAAYSGALFPAMGNHECTGATSSNCGPDSPAGLTSVYLAYVQKMLEPVEKSEPYYAVRVIGVDSSWTAKFVIVAANAWSTGQAEWLDAAMSEATTYTIVVRHEPADVTEAPGVTPSEAILTRHPYTLVLVGHSHTYARSADRPREVIIGNGGAPLSGKSYGFGIFRRRVDGAIVVDMVDWQTGAIDPAFHFAVTPAGEPAPG
jgi:hypothetical protein